MDDDYEEEVANPAIEFVKVEPESLDQQLELDDMEIEDVKDLQRNVKVLPKVRPHTNSKIMKKKIIRLQYYGKHSHDVLKQKKLKPIVAAPNYYLVKRPKRLTIPMPQELCIALISKIEKESCIWDTTHEHFRNKKIKGKAWDRIAAHFQLPVEILKAKWASLIGSFRSYNSRYKRGHSTDNKPSWFAYDLLSFLNNELDSTTIDDGQELPSANDAPDSIISRPNNNRLPSPPEFITEYLEESLLPSNSEPVTNNNTAESDKPKDVPDNSCSEEILRIVRSMSKVLNKMANIGMSVDYGRYVNQHMKEYDDEIRRKTAKGIMDLITAADEEMSLKYPDKSNVPGKGCSNLQRKQ
ncbi:uncharacterized protein LOC126560816 [Anopheles maculipalpis]|uniref:uncharacterized protein LOC126560816 n=1 Tax=Anopheles maculipalpis TaxID=1496333 RepID=UPI002158E488|nr:uncharacterized protein LOC126560816 [Anopheles maculipalpis]